MRRRKLAVATIVATGAALLGALAPTPAGAAPGDIFGQPIHGAAAEAALGSRGTEIAALNEMPEQALRGLLRSDDTLWLDKGGKALYVDEVAPTVSGGDPAVEPGPFPYANTFALHSKPGSSRVIYLDFDGETISNTAWNASFAVPAGFFASAFDLDGSPATFSNTEQDMIQSVWQRVAEDYSSLDIDVTTQDPGAAAIIRTDISDTVYGTRALITNSYALATYTCSNGCGGIAYIGTYDYYGVAGYYQPALIFQTGLSGTTTNAKYLAEAATHEVGHNLGLSHDGTATVGYYQGQGNWAPIMGVGYYRPIVQWSRGEYSGANNVEDDFAVMNANGGVTRADDHANNTSGATALPINGNSLSGIITTASDTDWFSITVPAAAEIYAVPAPTSPNLDIRLDLYDAAGAFTGTFSDPASGAVSFDQATGLSARVSVPSAGTWYVRVDGVGFGSAATTGYSDYASVGQYTVYLSANSTSTGLLRVTTTPAVPSQITVDGVIADTWGLTWMKIAPGAHTVCFGDVPGYTTPACQNVNVALGATTVVDGAFAQRGTLRVITSPAVPSTISVDGIARNDWGMWTDLPVGAHQVCFGPVANFATPSCQNVTLTAGAQQTVTGLFVSSPGSPGPGSVGVLRVITSPALPTQIVVDGVPRDSWGAWFAIPVGAHTVCFTRVEGYTTPACQNVNVATGATTNVTGTFVQRGFLRVVTNPAAAGTILVNGVPRNDWGMWTDLPVSASYTVCFGSLPGLIAPSCQIAAVTAGALTTITGTYTVPIDPVN